MEYVWDLGEMDLMPEDQVHNWVEVSDNDTISGPKTGRSPQYVVRFPSIYEILQEVEQDQQRQIDEVARMVEEGRSVQKHLEAARRELLKEEELGWEKKQTIEADTIVTALPLRPNTELLKSLEGRVGEIYAIGDCREPHLIIDAIDDGSRIARGI